MTPETKLRKFRSAIGIAGVDDCFWRCRRGSELARGHWRTLASTVRHASANARELQVRLARLLPPERASIAAGLESMATSWAEEILAKFSYWDELPHCMMAMWPDDGQSAAYAARTLAKWAEIAGTSREQYMHRVTYRMLHPDSGFEFGEKIRCLAGGGDMDPSLRLELLSMCMAMTCEQSIEGVHAQIQALNKSSGRPLEVGSTNARLRLAQHLRQLQNWDARCFALRAMRQPALLKEVLEPVMPAGFIKCARTHEKVAAVYHAHPRQLFQNVQTEAALHACMEAATKPKKEQLHVLERMAINHLKERLGQGVVFSLPKAVLLALEADAAAAPPPPAGGEAPGGEIVVANPAAAFQRNNVVCDAIAVVSSMSDGRGLRTIGAHLRSEAFFKVVKNDLASRFLQHDVVQRSALLSALPLVPKGLDGGQALVGEQDSRSNDGEPTPLVTLDLLAMLTMHGVPHIFSNITVWEASGSTKLSLVSPLPTLGPTPVAGEGAQA